MNATTVTNLDDGARAQWAEAPLGARRRTARAVRVGAALAAPPDASLPAPTQTWGDLLEGGRSPAQRAGRHPCRPEYAPLDTDAGGGPEPVLFLHDTTQVDDTG